MPVTSASDRTAYYRFLDYLRSQRPRAGRTEKTPAVEGFSQSLDDPAPLLGHYWSPRLGEWVPDEIAVVLLDRPGAPEPASAPIHEAEMLKAVVDRFYFEEGSKQDEIWCTTQLIYLV